MILIGITVIALKIHHNVSGANKCSKIEELTRIGLELN